MENRDIIGLDETEWMNCKIPYAMMLILQPRAKTGELDRKLRHFACYCVRRISHLLVDARSFQAIDVAERFADGMADQEELEKARVAAAAAAGELFRAGDLDRPYFDWVENGSSIADKDDLITDVSVEEVAWIAANLAYRLTENNRFGSYRTKEVFEGRAWVPAIVTALGTSELLASTPVANTERISIEDRRYYEASWQCDIIRCIFGNPFHSVAIDNTWLTGSILMHAKAIYDNNMFQDICKLGISLRLNGCTETDVLNHCESVALHSRGCWVIDALLGNT